MLADIACAHCTLPVPPGLIRGGDAEQFCCPGCRAVFQQIHACGLADYYKYRDAGDLIPQAATVDNADAAAFDSEAYADLYVRTDVGESSTEFVLEGVTCAACVWLVERLPSRLPGLIDAQLSLADNALRLRWNPAQLKLSQIAADLMRFGYRPHPARGVKSGDVFRKELRARLVDLGIAGALTGNMMLLAAALYAGWMQGIDRPYEQMLRWISLGLGLLSLLWPGREFFRGAISAIRLRAMNLDLPICIALLAGGVAGTINVIRGHGEIYFDSLSALIFLLLIGRLVQFCQQRRARSAVELLFSLTPSTCRVIEDGIAKTIPIQALQVGQRVEVRAEELFPADGVVRTGNSAVDASLLTGESQPATVSVGDLVYGGSRNTEATLEVEVTAAGDSTRVGKLMRLIEQGLSDKPPIVRLTDRVAARFTAVVLVAAAITFGVWWHAGAERAIETSVALLIVTCPCVLGLAVPMTFALSIGRLARRGILVKSASALERLGGGGRLVLDKTGTLTTGQMRVVAWEGDETWQGVVSELERDSTHPVGRALRRAYEGCEAPAAFRGRSTVRTRTGGGIVADFACADAIVGSLRMLDTNAVEWPGHLLAARRYQQTLSRTVVGVAIGGVAVALAALGDALRDETVSAVNHLKARGFDLQICSGDAQSVVDGVARLLGIRGECARGYMSPEEKLAYIKTGNTIMVGDGVNDAAALAAADVGIAVAGGAEAALAAADVYISRPGLEPIVELVDTARHTLHIVRRNVLIATSYNVLAGTMAMLGMMHPLMAAVLMPMSSVTVLSLTVLAARRGPRRSR